MSTVARPEQAVPVARQRPVRLVGDDGVEVADQQQPALAAAAQVAEQVGRVAGRRALDPLGLRLGRQEGDAERDRLLGAGDVAGRRRHADERLQLALGHEGEALGGLDHGCLAEAAGSAGCAPIGFTKWKLVMRMPVLR